MSRVKPAPPPKSWARVLTDLQAAETRAGGLAPHVGHGSVPWLPYPVAQFLPLLADAVMNCLTTTEPLFLDVGCGWGTKIALAEAMFGLRGCGIDISPVMIAGASDRGVDAVEADCMVFEGYDKPDIVLLNRPVWDRQQECEERVRDGMRPGAILIHVNGRADPGEHWGWIPISQEYGEPVCGVWRKPGTTP
jgi:SAM-dependent methyltransferase